MRIIAVDDEKGSLSLLMRAIEAEAAHSYIEGFRDPREAIKASKDIIPDVAFLDIRMSSDISGLDMAQMLKEINSNINIIYVTGYSEYATLAFKCRASGYLTKPISREDVRRELEHLRNPVKERKSVRFVTFGGFDAYVDDTLLSFKYRKTKELLAYLFNKQGTMSSVKELEAALWESEGHESYLRRLKRDMITSMKKAGCDYLIKYRYGEIGLDVSEIDSDYRDFIEGSKESIDAYTYNYLPQYSWAEPMNATIEKIARKKM